MTIAGKIIHWFVGVPAWITKTLNLADAKAKVYIPIAINIVNGIKKVMDNPVTDMVAGIVTSAIPGTADDILYKEAETILSKWLPVILLKLQKAEDIANIPDLQGELKAALNELKFSSDEAKEIFWNGFAGIVLRELTAGDVTLQQGKVMVETYYQTFIANQPKLAA